MSIEEKLINVAECLEEGRLKDVCEAMKTWPLIMFPRFLREYKQYAHLLKNEDFFPLWDAKLGSIEIENATFKFQPQAGFRNRELFFGYVFYLLALKGKKDDNQEDYLINLKEAMTYQSIHAYQTCLNEIIIAEADSVKKIDDTSKILNSWQEFANKQGTPGYLLLANGYFHLANLATTANDPDKAFAAYYLVWKYLHLAKKSEPYCTPAINNAYLGKGLAFSNFLKLTTIDEMLENCASVADNVLDDAAKFRAEREARSEIMQLVGSFKTKGWYRFWPTTPDAPVQEAPADQSELKIL